MHGSSFIRNQGLDRLQSNPARETGQLYRDCENYMDNDHPSSSMTKELLAFGFGLKMFMTIQSDPYVKGNIIMQTETYKLLSHEHVFVFLDITDDQRLEQLAQALTECGGIRSSRRIFLFPKAADTAEMMQMIDDLDAQDCVAIADADADDDRGKTMLVVPQSPSSEGIHLAAE